MNIIFPSLAISIILLALPSLTFSISDKAFGMQALFNTKAAAEKAAKKFGCSGVHKMGKKWMPCSMQEMQDHEKRSEEK